MEDNFYPKYNESLNSLVANNSEFKIKYTNKIQDFFIGKIWGREKNIILINK